MTLLSTWQLYASSLNRRSLMWLRTFASFLRSPPFATRLLLKVPRQTQSGTLSEMRLVRELVPKLTEKHSILTSHHLWLDSAILKFADSLVSSDTSRARWRHVHKIPFNSKVSLFKPRVTLSKANTSIASRRSTCSRSRRQFLLLKSLDHFLRHLHHGIRSPPTIFYFVSRVPRTFSSRAAHTFLRLEAIDL